ncbi:2649_t:CDS:2 [Gigaspora rosea]|nr:2649_t:CDS:2 [Gigaspora rosea]
MDKGAIKRSKDLNLENVPRDEFHDEKSCRDQHLTDDESVMKTKEDKREHNERAIKNIMRIAKRIVQEEESKHMAEKKYIAPTNCEGLLEKLRAAIYLSLDKLWGIPDEVGLKASILDPRVLKLLPFATNDERKNTETQLCAELAELEAQFN